jgi:hypothetical protein
MYLGSQSCFRIEKNERYIPEDESGISRVAQRPSGQEQGNPGRLALSVQPAEKSLQASF